MERNAFAWEVKNLDESGYIEGIAAAFGNVDHGGDRILPGAFAKSVKSVPMLLFHDHHRPVGKWAKLNETDAGLVVEGKISTKTRDGGEAYELVKDGALAGLSIGYSINPGGKRMAGKVRELTDLGLHEVSLVSIGMNDAAVVTGIKDIIGEGRMPSLSEFESFLREAGFSKTQAAAIAGKGLAPLLRGEPGNEPDAAFWAALGAHIGA